MAEKILFVTPFLPMKLTERHREAFRRHVLEGTGITGPIDGAEELRRSRFFIETVEQFIASSETAEVKQLELQVQSMSADAKDEFWQWNYPIHWQDIFGVRIRSAFCAQLCSQVEATLGDIAHRVHVIERSAIQVKNLKGSTLEQHRMFLDFIAKFGGPSQELWKEMGYVFRVRNIHIHQQGYAGEIADDKGFSSFLAALPGVGTENNFVELKAGSCMELLAITERFHDALLKEFEAYRGRALILERLACAPKA